MSISSPVCTAVLGVSGDPVESHQKFKEDLGLPYQLLSDAGNEVGSSLADWSFLRSCLPPPCVGSSRQMYLYGYDRTQLCAHSQVRKAYGVKKDLLGLLEGRETYVIGKDGTIKLVFNDQFGPEKHIDEALAALSA